MSESTDVRHKRREFLPGQFIFAAALIGFGILCLIYLEFLSALQPVPDALPASSWLAALQGVVLILVALALIARYRVVPAALVVVTILLVGIVVLHIPSAFIEPELLRSPWWIRTFESLGLAGAALILAGVYTTPVRQQWVRAGCIMFGVSLPVFGVLHFVYPDNVAALVTTAIIPFPAPLFWAYLTGVGHFAAGVAILSGVLARPAAILAGLMYASWVFTLHLPRVVMESPVGYAGDRPELTSLFVCVAFWGAAWIVAAGVGRK